MLLEATYSYHILLSVLPLSIESNVRVLAHYCREFGELSGVRLFMDL